LCNRRSQVT